MTDMNGKGIKDHKSEARELLAAVSDQSPRALYSALEDIGYVGQEAARRRLCLMAYRHVRRLKDRYFRRARHHELPPKANILLIGPTGCGKTYLAELLFGQLLGIPFTTVDITGFSETGYVGRSVVEILSQLLSSAKGNPFWAQMGICIIDEFDKLAGSNGNVRFAGEGTNKDVSGYGVQRELLTLVERGTYPVPHMGRPVPISTADISFVACGAFSGIKELAIRQQGGTFGFQKERKTGGDGGIAYRLEERDTASVEVFQWYGFLPELIGRFGSIVRLNPLGRKDLREILLSNVLPGFRKEFHREGRELIIPEGVVDGIVEQAFVRQTGARGLAMQLTEYLEDEAFETFGMKAEADLKLTA